MSLLDKAANKAGELLASKRTIVFFALVSISALPQTIIATVQHGDITILVGWFSQNFIQLVSLAVLAYIAYVQGQKIEARDLETHDAVMAELAEVRRIAAAVHAEVVDS